MLVHLENRSGGRASERSKRLLLCCSNLPALDKVGHVSPLTVVVRAPLDVHSVEISVALWQNLTLRMSNRRFTRLTNGYSKKIENHKHMIAISMMHYNFCRIHQTLRVTPAMQAGIADHVWSLEEVIALIK
jgi:hypothetical protein